MNIKVRFILKGSLVGIPEKKEGIMINITNTAIPQQNQFTNEVNLSFISIANVIYQGKVLTVNLSDIEVIQ